MGSRNVHGLSVRHGPVGSRLDGPVETKDDVVDPLGRDLRDRDVVARQATKKVDERCQRADDTQRISMGLDDQCTRILLEQGAKRPEMGRRLDEPTIGGMCRLKVLQEHAVIPIRGPHVGLMEKPTLVLRHPILGREDHAAEVGGRDPHTFLAEPGTHVVHGAEPWDEQVYVGQLGFHLVNSWV